MLRDWQDMRHKGVYQISDKASKSVIIYERDNYVVIIHAFATGNYSYKVSTYDKNGGRDIYDQLIAIAQRNVVRNDHGFEPRSYQKLLWWLKPTAPYTIQNAISDTIKEVDRMILTVAASIDDVEGDLLAAEITQELNETNERLLVS